MMKSLTFNQLQLRILVLLFLLFTSGLVGYRYIIELPKLARSTILLSERELDTLAFSIDNILKSVSKVGFDYSVWTSTHDFMLDQNQAYVDEYLSNSTYENLEVDGIFYVSDKLELITGRGLKYNSAEELHFSFYDFKTHPHHLMMLPTPVADNIIGSPGKVGFLTTEHGPAIYNANQVRTSDGSGDHRGFLIIIKLLDKKLIETLSTYTLAKVSFSQIPQNQSLAKLSLWNEKSRMKAVASHTSVLLEDMNRQPVAILKVEHSVGRIPDLIDNQSITFITSISFLFYIVYRFISVTLITPIMKLASDIKRMDRKEKYSKLDENYVVKELSLVSINMNELMFTIKEQNILLAKQVSTDQLTQVMNRYGLTSELDKYKYQCIRNKVGFVVIMCDIDHFKKYNDHFGHTKGDETLINVAQALNAHCKRPSDVCARFGGEEFILLFSAMLEDDLRRKVQGIINSMKTLNLPHPTSPTADFVTISLGATIVQPADAANFSLPIKAIISAADKALYQAKSEGRDRFVINYFSSEK